MIRNLTIVGNYNVRDLGGCPTEDGHSTKWKVFVRAGDMSKVSNEGYLRLTDYGIKTLIDLRDEWEVETYPNVWVQATDIRYINLPLIGNRFSQDKDWTSASEKYDHLHELYMYYLDHCQAQIATIVGAMAESAHGTLFHCYMGKDRTGLIAGLLLGAVGVPINVIADDYAQTSQHYTALVAEWRLKAMERGDNLETFDRDVASSPQTMLHTLGYVNMRYGGVTNYLHNCGVTIDQIRELHRNFVES